MVKLQSSRESVVAMSQGPELEQTLQMPDILTAEASIDTGINELGSRVMNWAQTSWESSRRYIPRLALAGLATVVSTEAVPAHASTSLHRHSTMSTQTVLNKIHNAIPSGDGTPVGKILPTSAHLRPSAGDFRTDCSNPYAATYKVYRMSVSKYYSLPCGPLHPQQSYATPGEFRSALNKIGRQIRVSAGFDFSEHTKNVGGNRKEVVANFACPEGIKAAQKIVLDKASSGSVATITMC